MPDSNPYYLLDDDNVPRNVSFEEWLDSEKTRTGASNLKSVVSNLKSVALTKLGDWEVSTVFLSINHNYGAGPPILYETMVFGPKGSEECDRYETREMAEEGHLRMIDQVFNRLSPTDKAAYRVQEVLDEKNED